jgi:hypothetical protein
VKIYWISAQQARPVVSEWEDGAAINYTRNLLLQEAVLSMDVRQRTAVEDIVQEALSHPPRMMVE